MFMHGTFGDPSELARPRVAEQAFSKEPFLGRSHVTAETVGLSKANEVEDLSGKMTQQ